MEAEDEHEEEGDEGDSEGHPANIVDVGCLAVDCTVTENFMLHGVGRCQISLLLTCAGSFMRLRFPQLILASSRKGEHSIEMRQQENESILLPGRMDSIDGNNSLKRVDGSGHADEHIFRSVDDVRLCPGTQRVTENPTPADATESVCTNNWKTANTITDNTIKVFEQTGIFVSACHHGMVQTIIEMRQSGELAKYALATTNRILDVYGPNGATGYDIGCSYQATVNASSISAKARSHQHQFVINSFHGHAHNRRCQLRFHPLYRRLNAVAPVIRHASYFHWLQFIDLHFRQWDTDRYLELSKFLYNNYKQALTIIDDLTPAVEELKLALKITDADFERWNTEELEFLENVAEESDEDIEAMAYVEALESLTRAQ
ncbi:hypothetical protein DFH29DRAFT_985063 [Suillus ampliporus]|nr:hypothetical protein DFH29DRAFT_985063 [Suillus ampliporus]